MQLFTDLLVFLSIFQLAVAAPEKYPAVKLAVRQTTTTTTTPATSCLEYSITANMSVIGTNSSYRTAFLQKSPVGTIINARMLDTAMLKLPALTADAALNSQCGNLTEIATTEAANNYTNGIVAQFTTAGLPVGIKAGPEVIIVVAVVCSIMSGVWVFSA